MDRWLREDRLETLAIAWTRGAGVDWTRTRGVQGGRVVSLPTYPFERRTHWVVPEQAPVAAVAPGSEPAPPAVSAGVSEPARALLAEVLRVPVTVLREGTGLAEQGLSSLLALRLVRLVESRWAVRLTPGEVLGHGTVGELLAHLARLRAADGRSTKAAPNGAPHPEALEQVLHRLSRGEVTPLQALSGSK